MFISLCKACGTPAAAVLSFSYDDRQVWLDDLSSTDDHGPAIALCTAHSDSRTAPVGWDLDDRRRGSDRHLFIPVESSSTDVA